MKLPLSVLAGLIVLTQTAAAETVMDKVSKGASKVGDAVTGIAKNIDESIVSTEELIRNEDTPELTRERLDGYATETLARLFEEKPDAKALFDISAGYGVFDTRRIGVVAVSAGFGRGVAVSNATQDRTYMQMGTGGVNLSLGLGGFDRQIVILFEDDASFESFVTQGYDATADAGAMFGDETAEQTVRFIDGRSIFVLTKKGWKVSASASGTKYWTDPKLN